MLNPKLQRWFDDYAASHRHPTNQLTHKIAIPLIVFHILAMLDWVKLVEIPALGGASLSLGHLFFLGAMAFYLSLNVKLALVALVCFLPCFPIAAVTPKLVVVGIAVFGWIVQLAGHAVWEKNRPAFLTNLLQALIGPLFFLALYTGEYPAKRNPELAS